MELEWKASLFNGWKWKWQTSVSGRLSRIIFPDLQKADHRVYTEEASPLSGLCTSILTAFSSLRPGISWAIVSTRGLHCRYWLLARVTSVTHFVPSWENDIPAIILAKSGLFGMPLWSLKWESGAWVASLEEAVALVLQTEKVIERRRARLLL